MQEIRVPAGSGVFLNAEGIEADLEKDNRMPVCLAIAGENRDTDMMPLQGSRPQQERGQLREVQAGDARKIFRQLEPLSNCAIGPTRRAQQHGVVGLVK